MATKKYLDQQGLKTLIQGLKAKNDVLYAATGHAHAASEISYANANIKNGADIKVDEALDVLVANVIRANEDLSATEGNVKELEKAINALKDQIGEGTVADKIQAVQTALNNFKTAQATKDQAQDTAIRAAQQAADDAAAAVETEKGRAEGAEKGLADRLVVIEGEGEGSIKKALADAKTYADGKDAAIAAAKKAGDDAQADVDALAGKVGTVEKGKTVVGLIADAKKAGTDAAAAVTAEQQRAEGVEQGLRTDLGQKADHAAAEGSAFARIKQVKVDLAAEVTRADTAEKAALKAGQDAQKDVDALEAKVGDAADTKDDATVYGAIAAEKARAEGKEAEIKAIADKNKTDIATLNGADTVKGSVANKIKTAIDKVNTAAAGLGGRVDTLETKVGSDKDTAAADGSLYARVAKNAADIDAIEADYLKSTDKTDLQNAIKTERDRIDAFYASAEVGDKAIDTLKEIQDYITSDGQAAATMTQDIADNKAAIATINNETTGILAKAKKYADDQDDALHEAITGEIGTAKQGAIDAAAADATTKVNDAKTALQTNIDKKADQTALQTEIDRAKAAEAANKAVLDKLDGGVNVDGSVKKQIEAVRSSLQANIDAKVAQADYNAKVADLEAADTALDSRLDALESGDNSVAAQVKVVADDLKAHKEAQVTKEAEVDGKLDVIQGEANVEGSIKKALKDAKDYTDTRETAINGLLGTKEDAAAVDTAFGRIAKEVARATAAEEALGGRVDASNNRIAALEATVDTATTGLKDRVAAAEGNINTLQTDVNAAEADIADLQAWTAAHGTITEKEIDDMLAEVYNTQA